MLIIVGVAAYQPPLSYRSPPYRATTRIQRSSSFVSRSSDCSIFADRVCRSSKLYSNIDDDLPTISDSNAQELESNDDESNKKIGKVVAIGVMVWVGGFVAYSGLTMLLGSASDVVSGIVYDANGNVNILGFLGWFATSIFSFLKFVIPLVSKLVVTTYKNILTPGWNDVVQPFWQGTAQPLLVETSRTINDAASPYIQETSRSINDAASPYLQTATSTLETQIMTPVKTAVDSKVVVPLTDLTQSVTQSVSTAVDATLRDATTVVDGAVKDASGVVGGVVKDATGVVKANARDATEVVTTTIQDAASGAAISLKDVFSR